MTWGRIFRVGAFFWMLAYIWKLPAHNGAFLLTADNFSFFTCSWSSFAYSFSFFTYNWSFFAYNGKVRLIRALRDCKQRSLTVSKEAPTVSKKASPFLFFAFMGWGGVLSMSSTQGPRNHKHSSWDFPQLSRDPPHLSGPLRLRVQSRSRTRLRIAVSIAFLFRACFKGVLDTIAPPSRG